MYKWLYGHSVQVVVWPQCTGGCMATVYRGLYGHSVQVVVWPQCKSGCMATVYNWLYCHNVKVVVRPQCLSGTNDLIELLAANQNWTDVNHEPKRDIQTDIGIERQNVIAKQGEANDFITAVIAKQGEANDFITAVIAKQGEANDFITAVIAKQGEANDFITAVIAKQGEANDFITAVIAKQGEANDFITAVIAKQGEANDFITAVIAKQGEANDFITAVIAKQGDTPEAEPMNPLTVLPSLSPYSLQMAEVPAVVRLHKMDEALVVTPVNKDAAVRGRREPESENGVRPTITRSGRLSRAPDRFDHSKEK
ncbi:hypothetical protein Btru_050952 [Bulinus truncatus]|nr:hypothetical protein Btru_050952 [Bulinus truncatus]